MGPIDRLRDRVRHAEGFSSVVTGREIYVPLEDLRFVLGRIIALTDQRDDMISALGYLLDAHWPLVESEDLEDPVCAQARASLSKAAA